MMVMKDKLYKSRRKGIYYRIRRFFTFSFLSLSLIAAVAIPTYIAARNTSIEATNAQEQVVEDSGVEEANENASK